MNILLISSYPNNFDKSRSIFVYKLMQSLSELGCQIVVVSPQPWYSKRESFKSESGNKIYGSENAVVYRPKYFNFPNRLQIGRFSLGKFNANMYTKTVQRTINKIKFDPDIVYSHFLYLSGPATIMAARYFNVPSVVALGESDLKKHESVFTKTKMKELIHRFTGIICVSQKNKKYCINELGVAPEKINVFPNAVNHEVFYPRDKKEMREKYNLPQDKFIVAFTGHFIERKGPLRTLEAIDKIDRNIGGIFIGSGKQEPEGNKVLFKGRVTHDEVPELLSAADIFVLPTENEGSCNAIIEAMACGLPIVSSDIEAIKEQVNQENGILCDPLNVEEIKNAIFSLYDNKELVGKKSKAALATANFSSSENRAIEILKFLKKQISEKRSNI